VRFTVLFSLLPASPIGEHNNCSVAATDAFHYCVMAAIHRLIAAAKLSDVKAAQARGKQASTFAVTAGIPPAS